MRYFMTALAALSLGALPITAQVPARPTAPNPPAQPAGPPAQLTEQQRQQHQAIREKYAKELQVHRDAVKALSDKMRAEIEATLTPEQRQAMPLGGGRGMGFGQGQGGGRGMGFGQGQGGGRMDAMAPGNGQPQQRAMLWNRADRAARQIIGMRDRMVQHSMMQRRGGGAMGQGDMMGQGGMMAKCPMMGKMGPGEMADHAAMMGKMGPGEMADHAAMMGDKAPKALAPKVVKPLPGKVPPAPPVPAKKPTTGGGGA